MFLLWLRRLPQCGDWVTPASVPPPSEGRSRPINTPVSPPSSFILLSFAWFYVFFSAGQVFLSALAHVLHALLCLKVYSWCICGEKCTPHPPTPLPSCSLFFTINCSIVVHVCALFLYIYLKSIKFLNFWLFMIKIAQSLDLKIQIFLTLRCILQSTWTCNLKVILILMVCCSIDCILLWRW